MKAISVGVFNPKTIYGCSPCLGDNIIAKGLEKNRCKVYRFDYRNTDNPNEKLIEFSKNISPDLFWFGKCELIKEDTVRKLRELFPNAYFCKWSADVRNSVPQHDLEHLKYIDLFAGTFAGDYLKEHKKAMPVASKAVSMFAFTDKDYYKQLKKVPENYKTDILWTGRMSTGPNSMRNEIIEYLQTLKNCKVYGVTNWLNPPEYLLAINGAKIVIGANSFNVRKYSSDRLGSCMSVGTFYLPQYIEGMEEVFERGKNIDWFHDIYEMAEKIKYYLENEDERKQIAEEGRKLIIKNFDCGPLVKNLLHVLKTGKSKYIFDEVC